MESGLDVLLLQSDLENVIKWPEVNNMALHIGVHVPQIQQDHTLSDLSFVSECY